VTVSTIVIGVGNRTRSDDGAGAVIADRIGALGLAGVEVRVTHQLQVELAEECARFDRVVIVDASTGGDPVSLRFCGRAERGEAGSSHHLTLSALLALTQRLYGRTPEGMLCTVRGEVFGFGETLSAAMAGRVNEAVARIVRWIQASRTPAA
jgi:hydrogenase maturation protease